MKYLKIFLSISYLIGVGIYGWIFRFDPRVLSNSDKYQDFLFMLYSKGNLYNIIYGMPNYLLLLFVIGFFIYFILIKNMNLFWGAFCLAFGIISFITFPFTVLTLIRSDISSLGVSLGIIIGLVLRIIIIIGLVILFFYFRNKYKKSLLGNEIK